MDETYAIIGGGQAAGVAARTLRKEGFSGRLVLVGEEPELPYERPPLSKDFLIRDYDFARAGINPPAFYRDNAVEVMDGVRVERIDAAGRRLEWSGGSLAFDKLLVATGCRPRLLPPALGDTADVLYLRSVADARRIKAALRPGCSVILIGGGFIGLELAASARGLGCEVTVLEAATALLSRALPTGFGAFLQQVHAAHGVRIETAVRPRAIGREGGTSLVTCADGRRFEADLVIAGIGVLPNDDLAVAAGLDCDDGIMVDRRARSSAPHIWAAGDVSRFPVALQGRRVRMETWDNAQKQAAVAARNMLGRESTHDEVPWMWTDQYDTNVQILGFPSADCETFTRGRLEDGAFVLMGCRDGFLRYAVMVNSGRERRPLTSLIQAGLPIPAQSLADPAVPLRELAARQVA